MKRLIAAAIALIALFTLSGCAVMSGTSDTDFAATKEADMVFIGAPAPLSWFSVGAQGTTFAVGEGVSLTASHVATVLLKEKLGQHATCDVSAIARNNAGKKIQKMAYSRAGRSVSLFGYSAINSLPKSSRGVITRYVQRGGCWYGIISGAGAVSGMSGGPVIDSLTGETVGVITNVILGKGEVVFVPVQQFRNILNRLNIPYKEY